MLSWGSACFRNLKRDDEQSYTKENGIQSSGSEENRLSVINEDRKGISFIELIKREGTTLGLIISGGIDRGSKPKISSLKPGSIAHRSDALAVGDVILSVNGIRTSNLKHGEIVNLLKNASDKVTLEVAYEIPLSSNEESLSVCPKVIQFKLEKENDSFGFTLRDGSNGDNLKSRSLVITHVIAGGPADRDGTIKAGDRLLAVDSINISNVPLTKVLMLLKQVKKSALFSFEYDVSVIGAVKNATGPLLVEIEKTPSTKLGIDLKCISVPDHAIVIESIRQASVAERCGALHVGDHVIAIDDIKVELMTIEEATQLLKSSTGETVKLEILPISQLAHRRNSETNVRRAKEDSSYHNGVYNLRSLSVSSDCIFSSASPPTAAMGKWKDVNYPSNQSPNVGLASPSNSVFSTIGYTDRTEVRIISDPKGFGFTLQNSQVNKTRTSPFISAIERDSPAEKSGVLQITDRILAVNGENTEGLSLEEVTRLISHSHPFVVLITEFDVAQTVVPSSGTFVVKLAKSGAELGIVVSAPKNRQIGEPLIIADIKKGSIAHRTGSIQPGDELLAINSIGTGNCSVDDVTSILLNCSEIVKLRIRKDENFSDDPEGTCAIVYNVELTRNGGPLGITISGKEEPFHPIVISGLTPNGLAERTGALRVNDKILAINGYSLRGKTLSEAIYVLQTCNDNVTLKISKCTCSEKFEDEIPGHVCVHCLSENHMKSSKTQLSSVDSAVDSWGSCDFEISDHFPKIKHRNNGGLYCDNNFQGMFDDTSMLTKSKSSVNCDIETLLWEQETLCNNSARDHCISSDEEKENNWHKVLEDLQTCGQSQFLRQIERTILGADDNGKADSTPVNMQYVPIQSTCKYQSDTFSEQNLHELYSQISQLDTYCENGAKPNLEEVSSSEDYSRHNRDYTNRCSTFLQPGNYFCQPSSSLSSSLPIEIHKVTLFKDQAYEDFGFSLSDGKYENEVYINSIRSGGPADISRVIKPLDRILQVNNVKTYNAGLTVPLIASSGDQIELVISRPAYANRSSPGSAIDRTSNYLPWFDEYEQERSLSPRLQSQVLTKTL